MNYLDQFWSRNKITNCFSGYIVTIAIKFNFTNKNYLLEEHKFEPLISV